MDMGYPSFASKLEFTPVRPPFSLAEAPLYFMLMAKSYMSLPEKKRSRHETRAHITKWEARGKGYNSGGLPVLNAEWFFDLDNDRWELLCDDVVWPKATVKAVATVLYQRFSGVGGNPQEDPLVGLYDFGGEVCADRGDFRLLLNKTILTLDSSLKQNE